MSTHDERMNGVPGQMVGEDATLDDLIQVYGEDGVESMYVDGMLTDGQQAQYRRRFPSPPPLAA